jgi:hypothetical protein
LLTDIYIVLPVPLKIMELFNRLTDYWKLLSEFSRSLVNHKSRAAVAEARGQFGNPRRKETFADESPYKKISEETANLEDSFRATVNCC